MPSPCLASAGDAVESKGLLAGQSLKLLLFAFLRS